MSYKCKDCRHDKGTNNPLGCDRGISIGCAQFQAKAEELPEIKDYERTTAGELKKGDRFVRFGTCKSVTSHTGNPELLFDGSGGSLYPEKSCIVYRLNPKKIRADEVPIGRKFKTQCEDSIERVAGNWDGHIWGIRVVDEIPELYSVTDSTRVTLLPEE